jgi:hypothetical protein
MPQRPAYLNYEITDGGKYLKIYDTYNNTNDEVFNIRICDPEIRRNFETIFSGILATQGPTKAILWLVALDAKSRRLLKRRSPSAEPAIKNDAPSTPVAEIKATNELTL